MRKTSSTSVEKFVIYKTTPFNDVALSIKAKNPIFYEDKVIQVSELRNGLPGKYLVYISPV